MASMNHPSLSTVQVSVVPDRTGIDIDMDRSDLNLFTKPDHPFSVHSNSIGTPVATCGAHRRAKRGYARKNTNNRYKASWKQLEDVTLPLIDTCMVY